MEPIDHPVSRYALAVVEGREIAGELVTLACRRHLLDLETGRDRGLRFDCKAASRIINFAKMIKHTTGPKAGQPLALEPWQAFRHGSVFGWKKEDGLRRFRSTYHQVAKKNGKTTDTAVPMLFTQLFDGEAAPQGYCTATTRDQARLLFDELRRMIKAAPVLAEFMDTRNKHLIQTGPTSGFVKPLSRDGNAADGINPHFVARDEVHRWTDRELAEVVVNSMIARSQPIDWAITTAGADMATICGELREYSAMVLRGDIEDDAFFAYVAEPPQDCDIDDPRIWKMANPNLGVAIGEDRFREMLNEARAIAGKMPNFRRLHLNLWTEGAQSWIERDVWDKGAEPFNPEMLYGLPAWVGLDLSRTTDLTSICVAVPKDGLIYLLSYSFLPSGPKGFIARAQKEKREYIAWNQTGWLEVHRGGVIDEDQVIERLEWIRAKFDLQELAYDRWGMKYVARELENRRFTLIEHGQGYASMSSPMKRFEQAAAQVRLRHNGNPVLAWAVGNVHRDEDAAENVKPNKAKSTNRIDPAVAAIMAVGRAEAAERKRKSREIETV